MQVLQGKTSALLVALALLAGVVIGFAGSTVAYRYGWLHVRGRNLLLRMDRELHLTPTQHEQIEEVMEDTHEKMHELHRNLRSQRRRLLIDAYLKVHDLLTPEQQKTFDRDFVPPRFRKEAEQVQHRRAGPTPSPGGQSQSSPSSAAP